MPAAEVYTLEKLCQILEGIRCLGNISLFWCLGHHDIFESAGVPGSLVRTLIMMSLMLSEQCKCLAILDRFGGSNHSIRTEDR